MKIIELFIKHFKDIVIAVVILLVAYFGYNYYQDRQENDRLYTELIGKNQEYEKLNDYVAKLESEYINQKQLYDKSKNEFNEVKKNKDERIQSLSNTIYSLTKNVDKKDSSDIVLNGEQGQILFNEIYIQGNGTPPVGFVTLYQDGSVEKGNYRFDIEIQQLQKVNEKNGEVSIYSRAYYVARENGLADKKEDLKKWKDKKYPLAISEGLALIDPTKQNIKKQFYWWSPKFGLGVNIGYDKSFYWKPSFNFSIMGYGYTKNDLNFKFLNLGIGLGDELEELDFNFRPVEWRPFSFIPNTYIGAGLNFGKNGVGYFLNICSNF